MAEHFNPWSPIGVSAYPPRFPMVGQDTVYRKLREFVQIVTQTGFSEDRVAGFFIVVGGWGMGKSRLGHELVAEALGDVDHWVRGEGPGRVFQPGLSDGNLPLMVKFDDVVDEDLARDNFLEHVAMKVLDRFGHRPPQPNSNQDRAFRRTQEVLQARGVPLRELRNAIMDTSQPDRDRLARVMMVLRQGGIERLFLVLDELESEQELVRDQRIGVQEIDRKSIRPIHLDMLPVIVKDNDYRQLYPFLNFILLCSQAIGDQVVVTGANVRRTEKVPLERGRFGDVALYLNHVRQVVSTDPGIQSGARVADLGYPSGTVEGVYLATNGNLGWFNVVMNRIDGLNAEAKAEGNILASHELLEDYALQDANKYVFDRSVMQLIGVQHLDETERRALRRVCYRGIPTPIEDLGLSSPASLEKLLNCDVPDLEPALTQLRLVMLVPAGTGDTPEHVLAKRMVEAGFKAFEGSAYQYNACVIEPARLLEAFRTFSLTASPNEFLIYEDPDSFRAQLVTLYQQDGVEQGAEKLHAILMRPEYQVKDRVFIGPSWPLLIRLFRRAGAPPAGQPFDLDDKEKARALEKRVTSLDPLKIKERVCLGLAQLFDRNRLQFQDSFGLESEYRVVTKVALQKLQLTEGGALPILFYHTRENVVNDLRRISQKEVSPTILLFSDSPTRDEFLGYLGQTDPDLLIMLITQVVDRAAPEYEFLLRYSFRDDGVFSHEDLTQASKGYCENLLESWKRRADDWCQDVERQGYVLRPIFNTPNRVNAALFYRAFLSLVEGLSYDQIIDPNVLHYTSVEIDDIKAAFKQVREVVSSRPTIPLLTSDNQWQFPPLLWRILRLLRTEFEPAPLAKRFFYPKTVNLRADTVVQQSLELLCELNLVERVERSQSYRYLRATLASLLRRPKAVEDLLARFGAQIGEICLFYGEAAIGLNQGAIKAREHDVRDARQLLETLSLDFLDREQADTSEIARSVGSIQEAFGKMARICPLPLPDEPAFNLDALKDYEREWDRWTLWHKMWFLRTFQSKLTERRDRVMQQSQKLRTSVKETYSKAEDQSFPAIPLTSLLGEIDDDCDFLTAKADKKRYTTLASASLKPSDHPSPFYVLMDGRRFAEMWNRLDLYERLLSDRDPLSLWQRYKGAYEKWMGVRRQYQTLREALASLQRYFDDAPASSRGQFDEFQLDAEGVAELFEAEGLASAVRDEGNTLDALTAQVTSAQKKLQELLEAVQQLRPQAEAKLNEAKHRDRLQALNLVSRRKANRLAQVREPRLSDFNTFLGQQKAVMDFNAAIEAEAIELLGSQDNWEFYLQLVQKAGQAARLSIQESELEEFERFARETGAVEIRKNPEVVL